jgi:hypothetical protein
LNHDRYIDGVAQCDCGWINVQQTAGKPNYFELESKTIKLLLSAAVALVGLFAHFSTWGAYGFEIPVVTVQRFTGTLSAKGYEELAKVCISIGKYTCAKEAYYGLYSSKKRLSGLAQLASLEFRLGESVNALKTLDAYVKAGGNASEATLLHGRLLEQHNRVSEAIRSYELSIASSGQFLPVTATSSLVRILMQRGHYSKAYDLIVTFQDSAENAIGYLNTERTQLENHLHKQASRPGKGRRPAKVQGPKPMV